MPSRDENTVWFIRAYLITNKDHLVLTFDSDTLLIGNQVKILRFRLPGRHDRQAVAERLISLGITTILGEAVDRDLFFLIETGHASPATARELLNQMESLTLM